APRRPRWAPRPGPPAAWVGDRAPRLPELARAREARAQVPLESERRALRAAARRTVAAAPPLLCRRARGPRAPSDRPTARGDRPSIAVAHNAHDGGGRPSRLPAICGRVYQPAAPQSQTRLPCRSGQLLRRRPERRRRLPAEARHPRLG